MLGVVGKDSEGDIVQGIVLMRYGGSSLTTIKGIHERVEYIRKFHLLPPGMDIEPYYDRAHLVRIYHATVLENLLIGMVLVVTVVLFGYFSVTRALR